MKLNRSSAVAEYRLVARLEKLRNRLLRDEFADRLDKPLAFWALPGDRRLPLAFLGRTVRDLLDTPVDDLFATPGVGQKKIASLVTLLGRVATEEPAEPDSISADNGNGQEPVAAADETEAFDPAAVSEAMWSQWRATVVRHGLEQEPLGRFAPSLQDLPRVLWTTPLARYTSLELAEIRALKTHGEKRVHAVLEAFANVHRLLAHQRPQGPLALRVVPQFTVRLESWILRNLEQGQLPDEAELRSEFIEPVLEQVRVDAGDQIADLAEERLGMRGAESSVRQAARRLGLTRARVYQLLSEVADVLAVRWPEGEPLVARLCERLRDTLPEAPQHERLFSAADLFFPSIRDLRGPGRGGPLDVTDHRRAG